MKSTVNKKRVAWNKLTDEQRKVRFLEHIDFTDECWFWKAFIHPKGYGKFRFNSNKMGHAHRFSYKLFVGPISNGLELDHLCRNRICVNPGHLEQVTHKENVLRGNGLASKNHKKTHCYNGHLYDKFNTHFTKEGKRRCKKCLYMQGRLSEKEFNRCQAITAEL